MLCCLFEGCKLLVPSCWYVGMLLPSGESCVRYWAHVRGFKRSSFFWRSPTQIQAASLFSHLRAYGFFCPQASHRFSTWEISACFGLGPEKVRPRFPPPKPVNRTLGPVKRSEEGHLAGGLGGRHGQHLAGEGAQASGHLHRPRRAHFYSGQAYGKWLQPGPARRIGHRGKPICPRDVSLFFVVFFSFATGGGRCPTDFSPMVCTLFWYILARPRHIYIYMCVFPLWWFFGHHPCCPHMSFPW